MPASAALHGGDIPSINVDTTVRFLAEFLHSSCMFAAEHRPATITPDLLV
jgi:hypothetical protein